jgi:hypothetical protein
MSTKLISNSPEFYRAVELLREFDPPMMAMIMFAALAWSDERCKQERADGDLPGTDTALSPLRIVN